jgi:membrane-bound lytic murein transglycosylase MltF
MAIDDVDDEKLTRFLAKLSVNDKEQTAYRNAMKKTDKFEEYLNALKLLSKKKKKVDALRQAVYKGDTKLVEDELKKEQQQAGDIRAGFSGYYVTYHLSVPATKASRKASE